MGKYGIRVHIAPMMLTPEIVKVTVSRFQETSLLPSPPNTGDSTVSSILEQSSASYSLQQGYNNIKRKGVLGESAPMYRSCYMRFMTFYIIKWQNIIYEMSKLY